MGDPAYLKNLRKFGSGEPTTEELAALEENYIHCVTRAAAVGHRLRSSVEMVNYDHKATTSETSMELVDIVSPETDASN